MVNAATSNARSDGTRVDVILGPERFRDQGLGPHQQESGNRAILALLSDPEVRDQVDLVITWRQPHAATPVAENPVVPTSVPSEGAYEVWAQRGMVRFRRVLRSGGNIDFEVLEVIGENPLARQDPSVLQTLAQEKQAARASGFDVDDPKRRFIAASEQSYPYAYERVAQLFDSPNAPDLVISPNDWSFGVQLGQHGALNVRQSRAPLWFCGPRVRPGQYELAARAVDIAPTALAALDFPRIDGADASGRSASERGVEADVYLRRQDGAVLESILEFSEVPPKRLYIFLLDGIHPTTLEERLAEDPDALPGLRRLRERAAVLAFGSIVTFPSITWPSHTTIGTGTWCGHHDVINPSYYLRAKRQMVSPQGQQMHTEGFLNPAVETIYEAFHRVRGEGALSAAIYEPLGRGADHAVLEGRNLCDRAQLKALNGELARDTDPRWRDEGVEEVAKESVLDTRGLAQVVELFSRDDGSAPSCVFHELVLTDGAGHEYGPGSSGLKAALDESDRRVARVLALLEERGLLEETLFVVTADHGMSPQDVSLRANPARHVEKIGLAAEVAEPMIWLRDLAVLVERAADGRTGRVRVFENDALEDGVRPAFEGAEVAIELERPGAQPETLVVGRTGPGGVFGFVTPAALDSSDFRVRVAAEGFNPRSLRLDGTCPVMDLRRALYDSP